MKITRVETLLVRIDLLDRFGGQASGPAIFDRGLYHFEKEWNDVHPTVSQCVLVRIETDAGIHGWGECQAPIAPEATRSIIDQLLAPMIVGSDPHAVNALWKRMYRSMAGRGHLTGFMLDAIAGVDIALWDIKGKAAGLPVSHLLGGPCRDRLPLYVSGLRGSTDEERATMANDYFAKGYSAVKVYIGRGLDADMDFMRTLRKAVGPGRRLFADMQWTCSLAQAEQLGRGLEELGVEWFECPLLPENVADHVRLAQALQMRVTAGEGMRTRFEFRDWLERGAIDIVQPDVARCGITEARRIAELAEVYDRPAALHLGLSFGVANAATWQVASAIPNFYIQECHPPLVEVSNRYLCEPLVVEQGHAVVPTTPGIGVDIDRDALSRVAKVS